MFRVESRNSEFRSEWFPTWQDAANFAVHNGMAALVGMDPEGPVIQYDLRVTEIVSNIIPDGDFTVVEKQEMVFNTTPNTVSN